MIRHIFTLIATALLSATCAYGQTSFHNEATDTVRINDMLIEIAAQRLPSPGDAVVAFGKKFLGTPYVAHTLEGPDEVLRVNIDELDCTTFAESMMALAMTVNEGRSSWRDFTYNLQNIRYRDGKIKGYPSRLHYIADWAVNNTYRGNFADVTNLFPRYGYIVKTINFMSANADKYEALADSANLAGIKDVEIGYRGHRFPYIKSSDTGVKAVKSEFRNGDIVAFTSNVKNLDVTHLGIIVIDGGEPYVMHASSSAGKVVLSDIPLDQFLKRNRHLTGVRVFRLIKH